jgi:Flp pilus assembly protein TadD
VLLVFALTRRVLRGLEWRWGDGLALWVTGLFALHPVHSQPVNYVCQRAEVLASLFYLLALLLLLETEERGRSASAVACYATALLALVLALGSKEIAVTFPAAYLLLSALLPAVVDRPGRRWSWRTRIALTAPFVVAVGVAAYRVLRTVTPESGVGFELASITPTRYALTQLSVIRRYVELLLWPARQNLDYEFPLSSGPLEPRTLLSGTFLLSLAGAAVGLLIWSRRGDWSSPARKGARLAAFGISWFFLVLAPTSSVVPVIDVIEEHRVYLASWGAFAALAAAASVTYANVAGTSGRARRIRLALGSAICIGLAVLLYERNAVWESRLALWRDVVAKSPTKARAHENLGHALYLAGDQAAADAEYVLALRYGRDGSTSYPKLLNNVGTSLLKSGRLPEAIAFLNDALAQAPDDPRLLGTLSIALLRSGDLDAAERTARRSARLWPRDPAAHQALGLVLAKRGDTAAAVRELRFAAELDPDLTVQTRSAALLHELAGRVAEACDAWRRYRAMRPGAENSARARQHMAALGCRD